MAVLYITEFQGLGQDISGRPAQIGLQPPVAEQTVAIGASASTSTAFTNQTNMVRLHTDAICSVEFGTSPTATSTKARMNQNQTEYFTVPRGQAYKVSVITNS